MSRSGRRYSSNIPETGEAKTGRSEGYNGHDSTVSLSTRRPLPYHQLQTLRVGAVLQKTLPSHSEEIRRRPRTTCCPLNDVFSQNLESHQDDDAHQDPITRHIPPSYSSSTQHQSSPVQFSFSGQCSCKFQQAWLESRNMQPPAANRCPIKKSDEQGSNTRRVDGIPLDSSYADTRPKAKYQASRRGTRTRRGWK